MIYGSLNWNKTEIFAVLYMKNSRELKGCSDESCFCYPNMLGIYMYNIVHYLWTNWHLM